MLGQSMKAAEGLAEPDHDHLVAAKSLYAVELLPPPPLDLSGQAERELISELRDRVENSLEHPSANSLTALCDGLADILACLNGEQRQERKAPELDPPPQKRTRTQVLLADNDPTVCALLTSTLSNHEMDCRMVATGGAVLEYVREVKPEVVVLSINLEELDGFQVLAAIKRDPAVSATRVVMLTSRRTEVDVVRAFGLGADDYVTKPFSPMEVAMRIRRLVGKIEV